MPRPGLQFRYVKSAVVVLAAFSAAFVVGVFLASGLSGSAAARAETAASATPAAAGATEPVSIVVPTVISVQPGTQVAAPVTAVAQAAAQPLTQSEGGTLKRWMYVAAALAALLGVVLVIIAVRGGSRRPKGP
jgi:hypothetical protein